ncbi:MAG: Uma2 family endonuclease [Phycisphaerales bacterium]
MSTLAIMTADELLRLPANGARYELIRGELRTMSPAGGRHGAIASRLANSLGPFVEANRLGQTYAAETGFRLASNPDTVRAPDFAFLGAERAALVDEVEGFIPGAPDFAAEVLSPGDSFAAVEEKVSMWLSAGTAVVIVIDPAVRQVVVRRRSSTTTEVLGERDAVSVPELFPGWSMAVARLFG